MRLILDHLSCHRGGRSLYRELSVTLAGGSVLLLRGRNGSGKSTLLRQIGGLLKADGDVRLETEMGAVIATHLEIRQQCHYIGHRNAVRNKLTIQENIAFWAQMLCAADHAPSPEATFSTFGLTGLEDIRCGLLSEGQRKRVSLTRITLAQRPLWLLDEPLPTLDDDNIARLIALLSQHLEAGGLAVVATHHPLPGLDAESLYLS